MVGRPRLLALSIVLLFAVGGLPTHAGELHPWLVITSSTPESNAQFGRSVAVDGEWMIVGAPNEDAGPVDGAVYFFSASTGGWLERQHIAFQSTSANFGHDVAISNGWAAVGAPYEGRGEVHLYRLQGGTWHAADVLKDTGGVRFGWSLAMQGTRLLVGDPGEEFFDPLANSGQVTVYDRSGGSWSKTSEVTRGGLGSSNQFGADVAYDGGRAVIGAPARAFEEEISPGAVWFFDVSGSTWTERGRHTAGDGFDLYGDFGGAVAIDGDQVFVTDNPYGFGIYSGNEGDLFTYERRGSSWIQTDAWYIYGQSVSIEGDLAAVGTGYGEVIMFENVNGWHPVSEVPAHYSSSAGTDVQLQGGTLYVGAPGYDDRASNIGAVMVFIDGTPPIAVAGPDIQAVDLDGDNLSTIQLNGSASHDPDGVIVRHEWYQDGKLLATGAMPALDLPIGKHSIDLLVTDDSGLSDRDRVIVRVYDGPDAEAAFSYSPKSPDVGEWVRFQDESTHPLAAFMTWDWDFDGDGRSDATGHAPGHAFDSSGRHPVTLTLTTSNGEELSVTRTVRVDGQAPNANAGPDVIVSDTDANGKETVTLDGGASEDPDGTALGYRWTLEGRSQGSSAKLTTELPVGHHKFQLQVTDDDGKRDTDTVVVLVKPDRYEAGNATKYRPESPTGAIGWALTSGVHPHRVVDFKDQSLDPETEVIMWSWELGDGTKSTDRNVRHAFPDYGTYTAKLSVTDTDGNQASVSEDVTIENQAPTVGFLPKNIDAVPAGQPIVFFDTSADPEDSLVRWTWDFGDGNQSSRQDVGHRFETPGNYTVVLSVEDDGGLVATSEMSLRVEGIWNGTVGSWTNETALAAIENGTIPQEVADKNATAANDAAGPEGERASETSVLKRSVDLVQEPRWMAVLIAAFAVTMLLTVLIARRKR